MLEPLQQQTCRANELATVDHICAGVFSHSWPELLELSAVTAAHATRYQGAPHPLCISSRGLSFRGRRANCDRHVGYLKRQMGCVVAFGKAGAKKEVC